MEPQECYVFPLWNFGADLPEKNRYDFRAGEFVISLVRIEGSLLENSDPVRTSDLSCILKDRECGWALAVPRLPGDKDKGWDAVEEKYYRLIRTFLSSLTVVSGSNARALHLYHNKPPIGTLGPDGLVSVTWEDPGNIKVF